MLNIKLATVYGIIKKYQTAFEVEAKKRGGNRQKLLAQQAISDIECWINDDCTVTLKSLQQKSLQEHGVQVFTTTIAREIKGFNYSLKMVKLIPERRNAPTTIEDRKMYTTQFYVVAREIPDSGLIYLDEVGRLTRCVSPYIPTKLPRQATESLFETIAFVLHFFLF